MTYQEAVVPEQPSQDVMRDPMAWCAWAEDQFRKEKAHEQG
jgi:hypothetical protein